MSILNLLDVKTQRKLSYKGDPSDVFQWFPKYQIQVLCCRYWWLKQWEFRELSFPYWRVYYNTKQGAFITYQGEEYELLPSKIYMIAPNTSYATRLFNHVIPDSGFAMEGGRIDSTLSMAEHGYGTIMEHLFIHFNTGMPYDNIAPGIFTLHLNESIQRNLYMIMDHLKKEASYFDFHAILAIQSLIHELLLQINPAKWNAVSSDHRVLAVLEFVENNLDNDLSNQRLATCCHMSTNAFTRIFAKEVGLSPQRFVKKKRIDAACVMLHHTDKTIDEVASATGFANRYHFTRIFGQTTGLSPAKYRKEFGIK